jgi:type III secretion protein T
MESLLLVGSLTDIAMLVGLAVTRVSVAFLLIPIFTSEMVPTLVRNTIFVALAVLVVVVQPTVDVKAMSSQTFLLLFMKEAFIGIIIGFFFGAILWALEGAGHIIDTKVGTTMASLVDPLSGHQTSLIGAFLARFANFIFMFSGGFMLMVGVIIESYGLWPINSAMPDLKRFGVGLFEMEFSRLMLIMLAISAPALVVMFAVDLVLGLINRYAQQLNVFSLSFSLKAWASTAIVLVMLSTLTPLFIDLVLARPPAVMAILRSLLNK